MEPLITVRQAKNKDWEVVMWLEKIALGPMYSTGVEKEDITRYIKYETILLAYSGKEIVGKISYVEEENVVDISGLIIVPKWRGKGFGKKLTMMMMEIFPGAKTFKLTVHPKNVAAIKIYTNLGFEEMKVVADYYGDGEPRLLMELNREGNK